MAPDLDIESSGALERPKVLIVDDQARNLDVLEAMLEPLACAFVRAESADEALLCLLRHDFAAIVLDIRMPGMGGIELATLIKQRKRSQHVPILFLTAHVVDEEDVIRGYGVGAVDYLSKPINAEILRSKVGVFIELFRKTRALGAMNETLQREVADREEAQEALRRANQQLEERVQERTAELTRVHRGVAENELRLRLAIEVASMGAWEWDLASGGMAWSTDPESLFGFPRGSLGPDLRLQAALHPEDKAVVEQAIAVALDTGLYQAEYRAVRPDRSLVWLTDRGRVIFDADGRPERMAGITRNITPERQAAQEREKLLRDAQEARDAAQAGNRAKDEFLAMLSHELRNPLNVIAMGMSILDSAGRPGDQLARTRQLITRQLRHLTSVMDDLLDIARVTTGRIALSRQPVDLSATVDRCLAALADTGRLARHTWKQTLEPVWIDGDATRIDQIIMNLMTNAIRFTPPGGSITVTLAADRDEAVLSVADTGVGIEAELLPRIFDLFVQGDRSSDRAQGGLGLGLTLVRSLTQMHNGTVAADSDGPGRGATLTVRLPRIPPMARERVRQAGANVAAGRRILAVEDNADGRELLRRMLEIQGHEVYDAGDGESAVRMALELRPDTVIVDIGLPGIDGYTVAQRLRAAGHSAADMQLIALTGYGTAEDRRRAAEAGFDVHLTKPVDHDILERVLMNRRSGASSRQESRPS